MRIRRIDRFEEPAPPYVEFFLRPEPPPRPRPARLAALAACALLGLFVAFCYAFHPGSMAAITDIPAWAWLLPGIALLALGVSGPTRVPAWVCLFLWIAFIAFFVEEARSLSRVSHWPVDAWDIAHARGQALRVVSLNCAGGSRDAAAEVEPYRADIVLLQEAPPRAEVKALARRLYGDRASVIQGPDAAILARGLLTERPMPDKLKGTAVMADLRLSSGAFVRVVSLRLGAPVARWDLWAPSCWKEHARARDGRKLTAQMIASSLDALPSDAPVIVGGDFNSPQGDAAPRALAPRLHDAFDDGGRGWGDTVMNDFPALRFDQVWVSSPLHAGAVFAHRTRHSDHRLAVADLWLKITYRLKTTEAQLEFRRNSE